MEILIYTNIGVAAPMAFFGDMHGQGMDAVEFFTQQKIVVEGWPRERPRKF